MKPLGSYGSLTVGVRDDGLVVLDFTGGAVQGPFVTLNAIQWQALQRVIRSISR